MGCSSSTAGRAVEEPAADEKSAGSGERATSVAPPFADRFPAVERSSTTAPDPTTALAAEPQAAPRGAGESLCEDLPAPAAGAAAAGLAAHSDELYHAADSAGLTEDLQIRFRVQQTSTDVLEHSPSSEHSPAFALSSVCGRRPQQEDAHAVARPLLSKAGEHVNVFGVFDGHGGQRCSEFVGQQLLPALGRSVESAWEGEDTHEALKAAFRQVDAAFLESLGDSDSEVGSTAVVAMLMSNGRQLHCAWVGDSRAILCRADGVVLELSQDHKPSRADEKERIQATGGIVYHNRVNGVLGVSRAFGDRALKQWVPAEPEVMTVPLASGDDFLVLACDGLWDVADSEMVAKLVRKHTAAAGLDGAARALTTFAIRMGSADNVTAMIVQLEDGSGGGS